MSPARSTGSTYSTGLGVPLICAMVALGCVPLSWRARGPNIALYYGKRLPTTMLAPFDQVVVEPDNVLSAELARVQRQSQVFAYLSVSQVNPSRAYYPRLQPQAVLGHNGSGDAVVDPSHPSWRQMLLARAEALWQRGYRGFFLDNVASYVSYSATDATKRRRRRAVQTLIDELSRRHPNAKLLLHGGFDLAPELASRIVGVCAGSFFSRWDAGREAYVAVSPARRRVMQTRLRALRALSIPVTILDHVPPVARETAREVARRIAELGFIPYVAAAGYKSLGVGLLEPIPRRVLVIYDSQESHIRQADAHLKAAMPLEHLGYVPEYHDVRAGLPAFPLRGRYAGIVSWFADDMLSRPAVYREWLLRQLRAKVPVAILGRIGFEVDTGFLKRLGLTLGAARISPPVQIGRASRLLNYEVDAQPLGRALVPWRISGSRMRSQLRLVDAAKNNFDPVAIGDWGGYALEPYIYHTGFAERTRWIIQPFEFLRQALKLQAIPALDVTTENGSRILTSHIDGDGFVSRAEWPGTPLAGQVILDRILKRYRIPTTVSIIEGEIGAAGLYPKLVKRSEAIAKKIFRLAHVEVASHAYSHPFDWIKAQRPGIQGQQHHLPIPGYSYDAQREVLGSVAYINQRLAPPGKPVKVFLWTGETNPDETAVSLTEQSGLHNVNGGDTTITLANPSMTEVMPMGLRLGKSFQVYAPVTNENIYTNLWLGPFYGYRRVIETFKLTDRPRRLKAMGIYYHFYSGTKVSALRALDEVYQWAIAQETLPLWLSEYAPKVRSYENATLTRHLDGGWQYHNLGQLRTVRLAAEHGWPDLRRSRGVIGVRNLPQGRYVALDQSGSVDLRLSPERPRRAYLVRANAQVIRWRWKNQTLHFRLKGHLPVRASLGGALGCHLEDGSRTTRVGRSDGLLRLEFSNPDTAQQRLTCPDPPVIASVPEETH